MILTETKIKEILKQRPDARLEAEKYSSKLLRNAYGVNYLDYLAQINNYENDAQFLARKKYAVSNKPEVANLLRPTEKIWTAGGGGKTFNIKSREGEGEKAKLENKLVNFKGGQSLSEYIRYQYFDKLIVDPNGLIFFDIENTANEDEPEVLEPMPKYKSSFCIWDYQLNGIDVEWVVFFEILKTDGENSKETNKMRVWVVDDTQTRQYLVTPPTGVAGMAQANQKPAPEMYLEATTPNTFGYVPGIAISPLEDWKNETRVSPIDCQVELLDRLLISNSVLSINEFFHNYINGWEYASECKTCGGVGTIMDRKAGGGLNDLKEVTCPSCEGSTYNKTDVTDTKRIKPPTRKDDPIVSQPFGYVYVPTDGWKYQVDSIANKRNFIFYSQWGTIYEVGVKSETATGRFLDVQPVEDRLDWYSGICEHVHAKCADIAGTFYYPLTYQGSEIKYGRRYLVEPPDAIWKRYQEARGKAPEAALDRLYWQYLSSEFKESAEQFLTSVKKMEVEPFIHHTVDEILANVMIPENLKKDKIYFSEWSKTLTNKEWISGDPKVLKAQLTTYASQFEVPKVEPNIVEPK